MKDREQWGSRVGFILAALGSAIGLGNIWRFPYVVANNGGGAFLIAYFVALITAGIPLVILEFSLGHKMRTSAPGIFRNLGKKYEALGWWQTFISFGILVYYVIVVAWTLSYVFHGLTVAWGEDTNSFFFNTYLKISDSPFNLGGLRLNILIPLIIIWCATFFILAFGVKRGIERASKIFMPLLIVLMLIITLRGITLGGAAQGLNYMFTPDFSKLFDGRIWVAAYGQLFYSLSICFGIMFAYSSYLPKKSDIVNNAFITAFGNCSFSLLSGIAVFSILGHMAQVQQVGVDKVATAGVGLAFVALPEAINALPGARGIFGAVFFLCLLFAGFTSFISIAETFLIGICDKFKTTRLKALAITTIIGGVISLVFATGAGLYILDIIDHFINAYGVAISGLIEAIILAWFFNLEEIRNYVNPISDFGIGKWWNYCIKFLTPAILGIMTILSIITDIRIPYEGYPIASLLTIGVGFIVVSAIMAKIFAGLKWKEHLN